MKEGLEIKGEWYLQYNDGPVLGPFTNAMTADGLAKFAEKVAGLNSPFIAGGDAGGETWRTVVGAVIQGSNLLRFRATLSLSEANGDHTYLALYSDATSTLESGIQINELTQNYSKLNTQVLNIECRFTFQQGSA